MYSAVVLEGVLAQLCAIGRVVHQAKFFATKYRFQALEQAADHSSEQLESVCMSLLVCVFAGTAATHEITGSIVPPQ